LEKRSVFDKVKTAITGNDQVDIQNCKLHVDESIRNMAFLMVFESFEEETKSDVTSKLSSKEAKNFWIQRIGVQKTSIGNDAFTKAYLKFLYETHGWDEKEEVIQEHVLGKIIKSTIGESSSALIVLNFLNLIFQTLEGWKTTLHWKNSTTLSRSSDLCRRAF
jgi:hypothetical protein